MKYGELLLKTATGEIKNAYIEGMMDIFEIDQSLSQKSHPYDNSVSKVTFKSLKN